uniref:Peptidase C1A papain C-terminal domain-containing protein n=1 Tax=Mola mola TaxID=94237 RepID=A0A3Q3XDK2_MOLML
MCILSVMLLLDILVHSPTLFINRSLSQVFLCQTENIFKRAVWEKNVQLLVRRNQEASAERHGFTLGLNHLADMVSVQQFVLTVSWSEHRCPNTAVTPRVCGILPYVTYGFKRLCGSCWAFRSLGALEGQMTKRTGVLDPLSPQNLVDCIIHNGNLGCRGGYISKSYNYIIRHGEVDSESLYPYEHQGAQCHNLKHKEAS